MVRTILVLLVLTLSGCQSTQTQKLVSTKVGIITPVSHNNEFCYLYKGVTVFNNESKSEQLDPNFSLAYNESVLRGVRKSDNEPVVLGELDVNLISEYFVRKEWDHTISVTDKGETYIKNLIGSQQVDFILLPWLYDLERCMVRVEIGYSDLDYALDSNIQLHLLDARSLEHMQVRQVNSINSLRTPYLPTDKPAPSETDKDELSSRLFIELEDDVFRLLDGDCCYAKRDDIP